MKNIRILVNGKDYPHILWKIQKNIPNHQPDNKRKQQINTMRFPKKKLRHREGGETDHGWRHGGQSGRHGLPKTRKWRLHGGNGGLAIAKIYHPI